MAGAVFGHQRSGERAARDLARELLARVGLARPRACAGRRRMTYIDQKRVELARALASDPRVLLLDEWLAGLNPSELEDRHPADRRAQPRRAGRSSWSSM